MSTPISIRLDEDMNTRLSLLAKETGRNKAQLIRDCISYKLEDLEDIYISMKRLEANEKMWSFEELSKKYL